ncbi:hypothetical protein BJ741DRAFT_709927 [Chytriomyces cf. hyalinus JEL632]|nr:hypothetical protein BJ741DRAFT_709924 [Chytriomyces cf. hyalinus JEL632]KAI8833984.1 hypothetical protein BJ741DRAFT_709927 [Chytriomyces cf. hyalinus JEL632]
MKTEHPQGGLALHLPTAADADQPIVSISESLVAPTSTIMSSIVPVATTTEFALTVNKDDATAIASKRQETQTVIAMQAPTNYKPSFDGSGNAYWPSSILCLYNSCSGFVYCVLLMPTNTLKLTRDSGEEIAPMSARS